MCFESLSPRQPFGLFCPRGMRFRDQNSRSETFRLLSTGRLLIGVLCSWFRKFCFCAFFFFPGKKIKSKSNLNFCLAWSCFWVKALEIGQPFFSENKIWFHTFFYLILIFKYWYYRVFATFSILGCGGSSLSREAQTSPPHPPLPPHGRWMGRTLRCSKASQKT